MTTPRLTYLNSLAQSTTVIPGQTQVGILRAGTPYYAAAEDYSGSRLGCWQPIPGSHHQKKGNVEAWLIQHGITQFSDEVYS